MKFASILNKLIIMTLKSILVTAPSYSLKNEIKMRFKKIKLTTLLFLGIGFQGILAQETISASGGNASGIGGSSSYSVGQILYTTNTGTTGVITQGVLQPYEIFVITGSEIVKNIELVCSVYPNPTVNFIKLKVSNPAFKALNYQLIDSEGNILENKKIKGNETDISMVERISAIYFIKIFLHNQEIKTFKIIKK
jgi:hypothetical protein